MATKQNNQQGRRSEKELAKGMLDLVEAGRNEQDIMRELGITFERARSVHYGLLMEGKIPMGRLNFTRPRRMRVTERGVFIPRCCFSALGLDATFPAGTPVGLSAHGFSLVMEPANTGKRRVKPTVRSRNSQLAIGWDGFADDVIALGGSDDLSA